MYKEIKLNKTIKLIIMDEEVWVKIQTSDFEFPEEEYFLGKLNEIKEIFQNL